MTYAAWKQISRARGAFWGQLAGDALGSRVEYSSAGSLRAQYPEGFCDMRAGGRHDTLPGQVTDDSELAIELAEALAAMGREWDLDRIARHYRRWIESEPFDVGRTTRRALSPPLPAKPSPAAVLRRRADPESQANGALMRQSPLGIWGWDLPRERLGAYARLEASLTHPHPACQDASLIYVTALADAIAGTEDPERIWRVSLDRARRQCLAPEVEEAVHRAKTDIPPISGHRGHVLLALHNAFYQLLHRASARSAIVESVMLGGDTDTNAAIAGALAGAVYGFGSIPESWLQTMAAARPAPGSGAVRVRPPRYWPARADALVEALLAAAPRRNAAPRG